MLPNTTKNAELAHDVDALRERFTQTQELYREVCALLFFRYGITPTANKLYQLVRKGSMSAPAEALSKFWEDLREKSRARIERSEEHTSELQSLMRISYAVFCLKKKKHHPHT